MDKKRIATHEGELPLGGKIIDCAVLKDNTRILSASAVFKALERPRKGRSSESYRADQMPSFLNANNLQPFVDEEIKGWTELIEFIDLDGRQKTGYNAKLLRGICKVYLDARAAGKLLSSQEKTALVSEKILYALADRGIESLVDEATGFDKYKEKGLDNVVRFLEDSLHPIPAKLVKTFPTEFFQNIFKLKNWTWKSTHQMPGVVGHYINDFVYSRIAPNFLSELQKMNPKVNGKRKKKHHQFTTRDVGHPVLKDHLSGLIALGKVATDWDTYKQMINKAYPVYGQTLELDFAIQYDKRIEEQNNKPLSDFDKGLKKMLDNKPIKSLK